MYAYLNKKHKKLYISRIITFRSNPSENQVKNEFFLSGMKSVNISLFIRIFVFNEK